MRCLGSNSASRLLGTRRACYLFDANRPTHRKLILRRVISWIRSCRKCSIRGVPMLRSITRQLHPSPRCTWTNPQARRQTLIPTRPGTTITITITITTQTPPDLPSNTIHTQRKAKTRGPHPVRLSHVPPKHIGARPVQEASTLLAQTTATARLEAMAPLRVRRSCRGWIRDERS
jgi:hypothetical protein